MNNQLQTHLRQRFPNEDVGYYEQLTQEIMSFAFKSEDPNAFIKGYINQPIGLVPNSANNHIIKPYLEQSYKKTYDQQIANNEPLDACGVGEYLDSIPKDTSDSLHNRLHAKFQESQFANFFDFLDHFVKNNPEEANQKWDLQSQKEKDSNN